MDPSRISSQQDFFEREGITFKKPERLWLHALLFVSTFISCLIAGTAWIGKDALEVSNWHYGITYAILMMTFLSAHEFGHYFAARHHNVEATLPFFIPMPLFFLMPFGTFGAVIKTRSHIPNRKVLFDIGVAGPIAGFIACFVILIIGFITLPGVEYLRGIHPNYPMPEPGQAGGIELFFGDTMLYNFLASVFKNPQGFLPPPTEIYHYPFLCVGWFGLFVTSLNLLPFGQLDGGHITYAMFGGKVQGIIARVAWILMIIIGLGFLYEKFYFDLQVDRPQMLYTALQSVIFPVLAFLKKITPGLFTGWFGWLVWAGIAKFFVKLNHPPLEDTQALGTKRMLIGWLAIIIFIVSFCYSGIYTEEVAPSQNQQGKAPIHQV
ncbi:MAG: site-2 protease family protein [Bacteroidota bacterium]